MSTPLLFKMLNIYQKPSITSHPASALPRTQLRQKSVHSEQHQQEERKISLTHSNTQNTQKTQLDTELTVPERAEGEGILLTEGGGSRNPLSIKSHQESQQSQSESVNLKEVTAGTGTGTGSRGREDQIHDFEEENTSEELKFMREQYDNLQNNYIVLQKREEYTKKKLLESQCKWTTFAKDILNIGKELYKAIENMKLNMPVPNEFLIRSFDKITKYEAFLNHNASQFEKMQNISGLSSASSQHEHLPLDTSENRDPGEEYSQVQENIVGQEEAMYADIYQQPIPSSLNPNQNISINDNSIDDDFAKETSQHISPLPHDKLSFEESRIISLAPLKYSEIKKFLFTSNDFIKICAILQALRWRITK
jgi:hypothetical protein